MSRRVEAGLKKVQTTLHDFFASPRTVLDPESLDESKAKRTRLEDHLDIFCLPPKERSSDPRGRPAGSTSYTIRRIPEPPPQRVTWRGHGGFWYRMPATAPLVQESLRGPDRLVADFDDFRKMNPDLFRVDVAVVAFIIDLTEQGLKWSTCRSYLKLLLEGNARRGTRITGPLIGDLFKIANLLDAESEASHAPDVPRQDLEDLLASLPPGRLRLTFFILFFTGARAADAERLGGWNLRINPEGTVNIYFAITKNHRRKAESYSITIRPSIFIPELGQLQRGEMKTLNCDDFNRGIKELAAERGFSMTSYTLRRSFVQNCINDCRHGDFVQWMEVAKLTGHFDVASIKSYVSNKFDRSL